jgi:predicted GIY-YIG superfamily endonuclease
MDREKEVIYKIPCEYGAKYIGETGGPLVIRVEEHRRNWIN